MGTAAPARAAAAAAAARGELQQPESPSSVFIGAGEQAAAAARGSRGLSEEFYCIGLLGHEGYPKSWCCNACLGSWLSMHPMHLLVLQV